MQLSDAQLVKILETNPNKHLVQHGVKQHTKARLHLYGKGLEEYVTPIEGFEKPFMQQLRLKYGMTNVDVFARLLKPIGKVFTARGGSCYYNLGADGNTKAAILEHSVRKGMSAKKWVEMVWTPHSIDDPMGLIFIEVAPNGKSYPTYKASTTVFDYMSDGGTGLEYVIFEVNNIHDKSMMNVPKDKKLYRVVDDLSDRMVIWEDNKVRDVAGQNYVNHFGAVPARFCGFIKDPETEGAVVSMLHYIFNLADAHLLEAGIKITTMLKHGFQKYWEYGDDCIVCKGSGKLKAAVCSACAGVGKQIVIKPGQDKIVEWPTKDGGGLVRGNPGGYIEPSKTAYDILTQEMAMLEDKMNRTLWGSKVTQKLAPGMGLSAAPNGTVTATEVMDNRQPEADSMHRISDAAESADKFIMDHLITKNLGVTNYLRRGGCSKNYGRRYLIEEPDALLERYIKARSEGVSPAILYGMYEQYLESKYQSDGISLALHKKLMKVEPFMHYTISELKDLGATREDIRKKQYYGEWLTSVDGDQLLRAPVKDLLSLLDSFVSSKPLPVEEKPDVPKPSKKKPAKTT